MAFWPLLVSPSLKQIFEEAHVFTRSQRVAASASGRGSLEASSLPQITKGLFAERAWSLELRVRFTEIAARRLLEGTLKAEKEAD